MPPWYTRWWRWFTNPAPMPGETWQVEAFGSVEVQKGATFPRCWPVSSVEFKTTEGEMVRWSFTAFLSRSLPGAPAALLTLRGRGSTTRPKTPPPRNPPPQRLLDAAADAVLKTAAGGYRPDPVTAPLNPKPPPSGSGVRMPKSGRPEYG